MRSQRGFIVMEFLVGVAIAGLILPVVVTSIFQMNTGTVRINRDFVVQQDIDRASTFFTLDLSQAQSTDLADGASADNIRVDWLDETGWAPPGEESHYAKYYIESGTTLLKRDYDATVQIVARYVDSIQFSRSGNFISVAIASSLGGHTKSLTYFTTSRVDGALQ